MGKLDGTAQCWGGDNYGQVRNTPSTSFQSPSMPSTTTMTLTVTSTTSSTTTVEAHLLLLQRLEVAESERRETWRETEDKFESAKAERRETKELLEKMQKTLQELGKTTTTLPAPTPAPTPEGT